MRPMFVARPIPPSSSGGHWMDGYPRIREWLFRDDQDYINGHGGRSLRHGSGSDGGSVDREHRKWRRREQLARDGAEAADR